MRHRAQIPPPPLADAPVLTLVGVAGLLAVSKAKVKTLRRTDPTFPLARKIGEELRWLRSEVMAWFVAQPQGWSRIGAKKIRCGGRFVANDVPEAPSARGTTKEGSDVAR